ncbi:peroxiredoxin [Wenzhouxiangella marina]|uniref:Glutathione-dependent peroxiredoxin n=1 Tax=Wenzhouxiangella marina TaxID=1579979 RepID=A0A0K0XWA1_9GAMM|nr:peroxiredoxin [Wenzhouxiangella marina]AKS41896.1 alkyl hydroperoxide reductase [Wenzhouxiangella marina]MBB6086337.1 peroxiredoxin [Wenzhouxiangella marina]
MNMIATGQRLPEASLTVMGKEGPETISANELLGHGRVVLFAVPGAFTPTCSARHLPGFVEQAASLKSRGVDRVVCLAVNDIFVLEAWAQQKDVGDSVEMVADGNGDFTRALGLEMDASAFGMGERSQRFAMILRDGIVESLMVDAPGEFRVSSAEYVLDQL